MTERISGRRAARAGAGWRVPVRWRAAALFMAALLPLARLAWIAPSGGLGANPVEFVIRSLGTWSLVLLLVTLAVTPMRSVPGLRWLPGSRRMLGLFAFFYASLHVSSYLWLDQWFDWSAVLVDVVKRPFMTMGLAAMVLMIPLAATSPLAIRRRLGRRWKTLHRSVYAVAVLAVAHYAWHKAGKNDLAQPLVYAIVLGVLLGWRAIGWWRGARSAR